MDPLTGSDSVINVSTVTPKVEISMETSTTKAIEGTGTAGAGIVTFQMLTVEMGTQRHGGPAPVSRRWGNLRLRSLGQIFNRWKRKP